MIATSVSFICPRCSQQVKPGQELLAQSLTGTKLTYSHVGPCPIERVHKLNLEVIENKRAKARAKR